MGAELRKIESAIQELAQQRRKAEQAAGLAALASLSEIWNQKAAERAEVGTLLVAMDRLIGGRLERLSDLNLPLLGSKNGTRLVRYGLLDQGDAPGGDEAPGFRWGSFLETAPQPRLVETRRADAHS
ncbi:hypothetical protein LMK08_03625 [Metapseudomonas furukawaii]|uniref:hypothetical protein n=1 Tax=Metapseudomonas furukawaii TaxID=1149133 RepID=UPI00227CE220|nr:hypothetical protein [Pseudomonas furukawaii]WAG79770.1 hypothetical protein LMK08_03625 [Pseudomonas furukawaii]